MVLPNREVDLKKAVKSFIDNFRFWLDMVEENDNMAVTTIGSRKKVIEMVEADRAFLDDLEKRLNGEESL